MRISSILSLVGVLSAGSAAAVVNNQVLANSDTATSAAATVTADVTASATRLFSSTLTETQLMYQIGDAGFITLDTAGSVLTIVSATANPGWELVASLDATVTGAQGAVEDAAAGLPDASLPGLPGTGLPVVDAAVDAQIDISIDGVADGSADGSANGSTDGTADGSINVSLNDQLDGADSATQVVVTFQKADDVVEFTADLLTDGTVDTTVTDPNANGVDGADGTDGTDGTDGADGTDGTDGTDGDSGVLDGNDTIDDAADCTGGFITVCIDVDADVQVNDD